MTLKSFNQDVIRDRTIKLKGYKYETPVLEINNKKTNKLGFIFINGLNGTKSMLKYFKNELFNNSTLLTFDISGQGENKNKGTRFKSKYIKEVVEIVSNLMSQPYYKNIDEWIILGESWGSALSILCFNRINNPKLKKAFIWNMPYSVIDISNENKKEKAIRIAKTIITFLFGIETRIKNKINDKLIDDKVILRAFSLYEANKKPRTKATIAAWRSFKKAWKNFNKNNHNIYYFQTGNDILCNRKKVEKFSETNKHIFFIENGFHVASLDKNVNYKIFNNIKKLLKR